MCMTKQASGKAPTEDITLVKGLHGGKTKTERKARKEAMRDMMKSAREDIVLDDNTSKEKGGQPAFKWLKEYAVELVAEDDYAEDSADDVAPKIIQCVA